MSGQGKNSPEYRWLEGLAFSGAQSPAAPGVRELMAKGPGPQATHLAISSKRPRIDRHPSQDPERTRQIRIATFTGWFYPLAPRVEEVKLIDIADGLAGRERFNGARRRLQRPLLVAQHAVRLSHLVPPEVALEALHHEDPEALGFGDMARPMVPCFPEYAAAHDRCLEVCGRALGFRTPLPAIVAELDRACAVDEWIGLGLGPMPIEMGEGTGKPLGEIWDRDRAVAEFIERHFEILRARDRA